MTEREGADSIGPITDMALAKSGRGQPPVMAQEMHDRLEEPGDFILLWAGAMKFPKGSASWKSLTTCLGAPKPEDPDDAPLGAPASHIARMLSPLSHEARIQLLQLLWPEGRTSAELSAATGLKGGNLH